MTTTDGHTTVDPATADRLARLQARRERPAPEPASQTTPAPPVATPSRRRSPASNAKIVTAGATATATLGLLTLYGAAEHRSAGAADVDAATPASLEVVPPASPATPPAPQVVVVVVDGRSGAATVETAAPGISLTTPTEQATSFEPIATAETPTPSAVPAVVELAVPAPPRPAQPAAPSAAPAPAPAPQASSNGS